MGEKREKPLRILLIGASGRMGREIIHAVARRRECWEEDEVVGGIVGPHDTRRDQQISGFTCEISSRWDRDFSDANVIIDFSVPEATERTLELAREYRLPVLIGTTGLEGALEEAFSKTAAVVPVLRASNTSIGVTVMLALVVEVARLLGEQFDIEIVELHHRGKRDAPSGTALALARAIADAVGIPPNTGFHIGRKGNDVHRRTGHDELGIQAVRGGDVAGEHTVFFLGTGERLEITHRATSRAIFAEGALRGARWLVNRMNTGSGEMKCGLFSMTDVLKGS